MIEHTFDNTIPPGRRGVAGASPAPWTRVLIEQAPPEAPNTFTQVADQAIAVDATPETPNPIDISVTSALERAWFRFRFQDAALVFSSYTTAVLSPNPNPLTLEGLKRRLDRELDTDDDKLQEYLDAAFMQAQAAWPHGCGRLLIPDSTPRTRPVRRGRVIIPDASQVTGVTVDATATSVYEVLRKDGYIIQITGLDSEASEAVIAGTFGFTSIPGNLADAIYVLAARMRYEEGAMYADNVAVLEGEAANVYYRQLPLRTKLAFASYAVPAAIAGLA